MEDKKFNNKAVVRNYKQKSFKASDMLIQATDKTTKEVKYFDLIRFKEVDGGSINTISESTDEIVAKKYFWHQKLNQYIYSNTGFTWDTSEEVIFNFYKA